MEPLQKSKETDGIAWGCSLFLSLNGPPESVPKAPAAVGGKPAQLSPERRRHVPKTSVFGTSRKPTLTLVDHEISGWSFFNEEKRRYDHPDRMLLPRECGV